MRGGTPNEALIEESITKAEKALDALDAALWGRDYFAGDGPTLADYFVFPLLPYLDMMAEGKALLAGTKNITRWQAAVASGKAPRTPNRRSANSYRI